MEKKITIIECLNGCIEIHTQGFTNMEVLGILRFQEKAAWLRMIESSVKKAKQEVQKDSIKMEFNIPAKKKAAPKKKSVVKKKKK
jgi:hypothetical protein